MRVLNPLKLLVSTIVIVHAALMANSTNDFKLNIKSFKIDPIGIYQSGRTTIYEGFKNTEVGSVSYAIKEVKTNLNFENNLESLSIEIAINCKLASKHCPNIVGFIGFDRKWTPADNIVQFYFVFELLEGNARQYFKNRLFQTNGRTSSIISLLSHILNALEVMHSSGIVHKDVKLDNILYKINSFDNSATFLLSDFGTAEICSDKDKDTFTKRGGTSRYCAPEMLCKDPLVMLTQSVDIYSLGLTLIELTLELYNAEYLKEGLAENCREYINRKGGYFT